MYVRGRHHACCRRFCEEIGVGRFVSSLALFLGRSPDLCIFYYGALAYIFFPPFIISGLKAQQGKVSHFVELARCACSVLRAAEGSGASANTNSDKNLAHPRLGSCVIG